MKRLALASILISVGAYTACAVEEAPPPNNLGAGTGPLGGASGTTGQGGTTGGTIATGGTTGGAIATGGTTGGATPMGMGGQLMGMGGAAPMGLGGAAPMGLGGAAPMGMGGIDPMGMGGVDPMGMGGMGMGGQPMGMGGQPMGMGGMGMGGQPMGMGGTAGGVGDDSSKVAPVLHGHTILMPCNGSPAGRVCTPVADNTRPCTNPSGGPAASYAGSHSWNEQVTLGGTPGVTYRVRVKIQGEVEGKTYTGGMDASSTATLPANGLYTGGVANNSSNQYNIYFIRTDNPPQHYYLNSIQAGNDTRIRHSTFPLDYEFEFPVVGGSTVCLVSADPNNSAIKNCAEPDDGSNCTGTNTVTVANLAAPTLMDIGSQPYNGQFVGVTVVSTTRMP